MWPMPFLIYWYATQATVTYDARLVVLSPEQT
jgi:hypothetical protein